MQAGDALVALDALVAPVTLDGGIALDPGVLHHLREVGGGMLQSQALQPPLWLCGCLLDLGFGGAVSQGCMLALPCPKHPPAQPRQVSAALRSTRGSLAPSKHPLPCGTKPGMGLPRLGTCKSCKPQGVKKKITHNKTGRTPWGRRWKGQRGAVHRPPTHIGVSLGLGVGADAGGDLFGHAPLVDGVFADWQEGRRR